MIINWEFLRFLRKVLYIFVVGYLLNEIFKKINGYSVIEGVENDFNMQECMSEVKTGGVSEEDATEICLKDKEEYETAQQEENDREIRDATNVDINGEWCGTGTYNTGDDDACELCPEGYVNPEKIDSESDYDINDETESKGCYRCKDNYYSHKYRAYCVPCPKGKSSDKDNPTCLCPVGQVSGSLEDECDKCPIGKVSNKTRTKCDLCPGGTIRVGKSEKCTPCPGGTVSNDTRTKCNKCPSGQHPNSDFSGCLKCENTEFLLPPLGCAPCPNGTITSSTGTSCDYCPEGKIRVGDSTECTTCPSNFSNIKRTKCLPCGPNEALQNGTCDSCPAGKSPNSDRTECLMCNPDEIYKDGICQTCPPPLSENDRSADLLIPNQERTDCVKCQGHQFLSEDRTECLSCPPDKVTSNDNSLSREEANCTTCGNYDGVPMVPMHTSDYWSDGDLPTCRYGDKYMDEEGRKAWLNASSNNAKLGINYTDHTDFLKHCPEGTVVNYQRTGCVTPPFIQT